MAWPEIDSFMKMLRVPNSTVAVKQWADSNMMWVEFKYKEGSNTEIESVMFGASK